MQHRSLFGDKLDVGETTGPRLSTEIRDSLSLDVQVEVIGNDQLDSCFEVSELAVSSIAAVASAVTSLINDSDLCQNRSSAQVDQRLAALWFNRSIYPIGWELPPIWDFVAGDYQTDDGWIKLHTNLAGHRDAALKVLGLVGKGAAVNRDDVASEILQWTSDNLELEIVNAGGVAAAMRSRQDWQRHPQGIAVASEPLVTWGKSRLAKIRFLPTSRKRPLEGLRVLDLTRVLAGPVATRTLASLGADVLRIDPPGWDEPFVVPDITLGKRCAFLDLGRSEDKLAFEALLKNADVLVHGYRPGALDNLGYDRATRQALSPNLIEVSLNAYGGRGPWANRRGFDSLVQMSSGIADAGMHWAGLSKPTPLPVQALDHATGYLMAAAVIRLIRSALNDELIGSASLSLARTAELLVSYRRSNEGRLDTMPLLNDFSDNIELTPWGQAKRLRPAFNIEGMAIEWGKAANLLGSSEACWLKP